VGHRSREFKKVKVTWRECPRITEAFIEAERRSLGDAWVRQEYECNFEAMEGLVYPDFPSYVVEALPAGLSGTALRRRSATALGCWCRPRETASIGPTAE
jgi:hypothetical protein